MAIVALIQVSQNTALTGSKYLHHSRDASFTDMQNVSVMGVMDTFFKISKESMGDQKYMPVLECIQTASDKAMHEAPMHGAKAELKSQEYRDARNIEHLFSKDA
jgi:hypothetical protein